MTVSLTCEDVLEKLSAFIDGELAPGEHDAVVEHVSGCEKCATFGNDFGELLDGMRRVLREPPSVDGMLGHLPNLPETGGN